MVEQSGEFTNLREEGWLRAYKIWQDNKEVSAL